MLQQWITMLLLAVSPLLGLLPSQAPAPIPSVFLPGDAGDSASPAFTPDGESVYFMRGTDHGAAVMESHRVHGTWTPPTVAPFSGHWRDGDPSMAPDGSFLVFASNRPMEKDGQAIDAVRNGQRYAGMGMNLWRTDRHGNGWSEPVRLPDAINACNNTFAPSIAADGSLYYIGCAPDGVLRPLHATYENGRYQPGYVVALGDKDAIIRDVAVSPDRSFMVFSIKHDAKQPYRLAIAFHSANNWSAPEDLGDAVNAGGTHHMGSQLGCDRRTLYFSTDRSLPTGAATSGAKNDDDHIWRVSLVPWLEEHGLARAGSAFCTAS